VRDCKSCCCYIL